MSVIDPVCGMEIEEEDAVATVDFGDETYWFCSESCRESFEDDPELYVAESWEEE